MANRYYLELEMELREDNDYMARKVANEIVNGIKKAGNIKIKSIEEVPFGQFNTRKLEDTSDPTSKDKKDELPF